MINSIGMREMYSYGLTRAVEAWGHKGILAQFIILPPSSILDIRIKISNTDMKHSDIFIIQIFNHFYSRINYSVNLKHEISCSALKLE